MKYRPPHGHGTRVVRRPALPPESQEMASEAEGGPDHPPLTRRPAASISAAPCVGTRQRSLFLLRAAMAMPLGGKPGAPGGSQAISAYFSMALVSISLPRAPEHVLI
jgi:hypothetical protein